MVHKRTSFSRPLIAQMSRKTCGLLTQTYEPTRFDYKLSISGSRVGEDQVIYEILTTTHDGIVVNVGAQRPSRFSGTRHMLRKNWSGVNVGPTQCITEESIKTTHLTSN